MYYFYSMQQQIACLIPIMTITWLDSFHQPDPAN